MQNIKMEELILNNSCGGIYKRLKPENGICLSTISYSHADIGFLVVNGPRGGDLRMEKY